MKKGTKIGLGIGMLLLGVVAVTSCTQSFCSPTDSARIMYAFEPGITRYKAGASNITFTDAETSKTYQIQNYDAVVATWNNDIGGFSFGENDHLRYLNDIIKSSKDSGYVTVSEHSIPYSKNLKEVW